ncbi:ferrous iron transport protein B [Candidatus Endomicrobiellum agilis]|uniref:ferrous iron transport protein B n=1 Tax=Candidatus Endomicrobiellum agilis TaxID=3238957 RepID=UPI003574D0B5|nr:ferrous iron transport protein B [Endomicrobium sp.]
MANKNIIVALAGNPNIGKSTIFNGLTGSNQHVGNYPGVTVEKKESSKSYKGYDITFIDLPGAYSLSAYSDDEVVTRDFLLDEKPDVVINVIDAANMERNLYLFTQIMELDVPVIIALNMVDILESHGKTADKKAMSDLLGVPVFATVASRAIRIVDILDCIINVVENAKLQNRTRIKVDYGEDIKEETDKLENLISKDSRLSKLPKRWLSIKLLDGDALALKLVCEADNKAEILKQIEKSRNHIKEHFGREAKTEIANKRYGFANSVVKTVVKRTGQEKIDVTEIIDNFVLNRYLGIPIFAAVMHIIFKFTFTLSGPMVKLFGLFFKWFGETVAKIIPDGPVRSLVVDGIIGGVGGVLGFFPLVMLMFFAIAFFEDSGYMARAAFVMDKIMSRFGLHGKSFLPLMLSTNGCAVPGILATRTLDSKRDRLITMFVVPFMICGAKLPVFALIIGAFFSARYQTGVMFFMYFLSVVIALSIAKLLSVTVLLKETSAHFVMELPPYHLPTIKGLFLKMWERSWLYVRKAGTVIVLISILIWAVFAYPKAPVNESLTKAEKAAAQLEYSIAGRAGKILEPLLKPIGMDGNRAIALIAGFAAKEVIVSTLGTIYSIGEVGSEDARPLREKIATSKDWSPLKGVAFLIFCLIYAPCVVSVMVFFKETGSSYKWLALLIIGSTVFAWIASFIVFQLGMLLKIGV